MKVVHSSDEDCQSGRHCCETSARFQEMNAKLDKLLGLFVEIENLKTRLTVVESENKSVKEAMKFTNEDLEEVKTNKYTEDIESLETNFLSLKRRNIKLEAYTRRENIKIFNIEENEGENGNTESLVRNVFREKIKNSIGR